MKFPMTLSALAFGALALRIRCEPAAPDDNQNLDAAVAFHDDTLVFIFSVFTFLNNFPSNLRHVRRPKKGFHENPTIFLDFASF